MEKNKRHLCSEIKSIKAREILDSRGNPTVEVDIATKGGLFRASVPSGASTGIHEAAEMRDNDDNRYHGKGVLNAVKNINEIIAPKFKGKDAANQKEIDELLIALDGTDNKSALGANAILPVSMASSRAAAFAAGVPLYQYISMIAGKNFSADRLPKVCLNIINGGAHAGNDLDVQEFMIVPQENLFSNNLRIAAEIYHSLKDILMLKFGRKAINVGDEGGFSPPIDNPELALDLIMEAAASRGYEKKIKIILDVAASQFFHEGRYKMKLGDFNQDMLADYYGSLIKKYPLAGIEDPYAEDDWDGWGKLKVKSEKLKVLVIGDDLLATNPKRITEAKEKNAANAMILKLNQIGTVSEAIEAAKLSQSYGWKVFVKNRSGETNDDFISDFALGIEADGIMAGAPARGERLAKYNRLLRIEEELKINKS